MGAIADAFVAAFTAEPVSKAEAAALGAEIEAEIVAMRLVDLFDYEGGSLTGKAGWVVVVNETEDGFTLADPEA